MKESEAWAYWDKEEQKFHFLYPSEMIVRMCSNDGFKRDEEEGKGKVLPVTITERKIK